MLLPLTVYPFTLNGLMQKCPEQQLHCYCKIFQTYKAAISTISSGDSTVTVYVSYILMYQNLYGILSRLVHKIRIWHRPVSKHASRIKYRSQTLYQIHHGNSLMLIMLGKRFSRPPHTEIIYFSKQKTGLHLMQIVSP